MSATSYTGVLHTKSSYAESNILDISSIMNNSFSKTDRLIGQIHLLRTQENAMYNQLLGVSDYFSFRQKILEMFDGHFGKIDRQVFQYFSNENIRKELVNSSLTRRNQGARQDVKIVLTVQSKAIDLQRELKKGGINVLASGNQLTLNLGPDINVAKKTLNTLIKTRFKHASKNIKLFDELLNPSNNTQLLSLFAEALSGHNISKVSISNPNYGQQSQEFFVQGPALNIFKFKAEDFTTALHSQNQDLREQVKFQLIQAREDIYNYIYHSSGIGQASREMQVAFKNVWFRNIENKFENLAFFEKGGVINSLVGAFGEFQNALLLEYINLKGSKNPQLNALISNTLKGEQDKADITVFSSIGFQVKNYDPRGSGAIDTNIHPSKLVHYPDVISNTTTFFDFLANFYFNSDFQEAHEQDLIGLKEYLGQFFGELANLAVADSIKDTVHFYLIEGSYLVPASYLLSAMLIDQQASKNFSSKVEITGPSQTYSDDEFENLLEQRKRKRREGLLSRYWIKKDEEFYPTSYNKSAWGKLISHDISIRSQFNYKKMSLPLSQFRIF